MGWLLLLENVFRTKNNINVDYFNNNEMNSKLSKI